MIFFSVVVASFSDKIHVLKITINFMKSVQVGESDCAHLIYGRTAASIFLLPISPTCIFPLTSSFPFLAESST